MITPAQLRWVLYEILGADDFIQEHPVISDYYAGEPVKRLLLAAGIADRFDQYTVYRPQFILSWNAGEPVSLKHKELEKHARWQQELWQRSKQKLAGFQLDVDKSELGVQLEKRLQDPEVRAAIRKAFPRISFFGLSTFTPFHLQLFLRRISTITEVSFSFMNPAPEEYWYHDISEKAAYWIQRIYGMDPAGQHFTLGNPLLMDWGRTSKELTAVFFGQLSEEVQIDSEQHLSPPELRQKNTLLQTLQTNIYRNLHPKDSPPIDTELLRDDSVTIASHYTRLREVEGLYDYLLRQIETHGYHPHEMVVLVPNMDQYTPFIRAVFDNAKHLIPYSIADRSYNGMDNPIGVLQALLQFSEEDLTSERVLQLLETPFLLRKSGIRSLENVRTLVREANIRFGAKGDPDLETDLVSWSAGIERLILGYAMVSEQPVEVPRHPRPVLPSTFMHGNIAADGLLLAGFVKKLLAFLAARKKARNLSGWKRYTLDLIDNLMDIPENQMEDYHYILMHLDALDEIGPLLSGTISYEIFAKGFGNELFTNKTRGKLISGRLSFSGMIPMRTIPYRLVAILGLDKGAFPRQPDAFSFDLMQDERVWGDRHIKEHDKYLFLETLIAAKDQLYLSYVGQNIKDRSPLPPSPVVDNLIEYIGRLLPQVPGRDNAQYVHDALTTLHPMHHYHSKYYDPGDPRFYTYLQYGNTPLLSEQLANTPEVIDLPVRFEDLKSCLKHPIRYYFNKTLGIRFEQTELLLPESEPFDINRLDAYQLKTALLESSGDTPVEDLMLRWKMEGRLPLKNTGAVIIQSLQEDLAPYQKLWEQWTKGKESGILDAAVTIGEHLLEGQLTTYGDTYIEVCLSATHYKQFISFQLARWLIGTQEGHQVRQAVLLFQYKGKIVSKSWRIPDPKTSRAALSRCIQWERAARQKILPFYPAAAGKWLDTQHSSRAKRTPEQAYYDTIMSKRKSGVKYVIQDPYLAAIDPEHYIKPYLDTIDEPDNLLREMMTLFYENVR